MRRPDLEEPEWDAHQRALMLALAELDAKTCPGCGGWLPETTDPDTDNDDSRATYKWHVHAPTRCHRCTAVARAREAYREADHSHALLFPAVRVPRAQAPPPHLFVVDDRPEPWEIPHPT